MPHDRQSGGAPPVEGMDYEFHFARCVIFEKDQIPLAWHSTDISDERSALLNLQRVTLFGVFVARNRNRKQSELSRFSFLNRVNFGYLVGINKHKFKPFFFPNHGFWMAIK